MLFRSRYDGNNTLRSYGNVDTANSWDQNWRANAINVDCTGFVRGQPMSMNIIPTTTPGFVEQTTTPGFVEQTTTPGFVEQTTTPSASYTASQITLTNPVYSGNNIINIQAPTNATIGSMIQISNGVNSETKTIVGYGSIILDSKFQYDYPIGSILTFNVSTNTTRVNTNATTSGTTNDGKTNDTKNYKQAAQQIGRAHV